MIGSLNDRHLRNKMRKLVEEAEANERRHGPTMAGLYKTGRRDPQELMTAQGKLQAREVVEGWLVVFSVDVLPGGIRMWHGSASLHPRGRSSTSADWATLGKLVALSGATEEAAQQIDEQVEGGLHPNRVHHWLWPRSPVTPETRDLARRILETFSDLLKKAEGEARRSGTEN